MTGDLFKAKFLDCHFDEAKFPILEGEEKKITKGEIAWNVSAQSYLDPRTSECELKIQRIIHLQSVANMLPDAFTYAKKVT